MSVIDDPDVEDIDKNSKKSSYRRLSTYNQKSKSKLRETPMSKRSDIQLKSVKTTDPSRQSPELLGSSTARYDSQGSAGRQSAGSRRSVSIEKQKQMKKTQKLKKHMKKNFTKDARDGFRAMNFIGIGYSEDKREEQTVQRRRMGILSPAPASPGLETPTRK